MLLSIGRGAGPIDGRRPQVRDLLLVTLTAWRGGQTHLQVGGRGFDPTEVRAYLEQIGREMTSAEEREQALRELLAESEKRVQNPVLDEATLTSALGQETARVLRSAHDAAAELLRRVEGDADRIVTEAQEEAGKLQARAEQYASDSVAQAEAGAAGA